MNKKSPLFSVLLLILLTSNNLAAQDVIRQKPCNNPAIIMQADSIKDIYAKKGFAVVREASVSMESEYEVPVIVPLAEGSWYQFVFIGDISSKLYEVRMYDWSEKQVVYQRKMWGDQEGNIIDFSYIPTASEQYMIKPLQVNKKKKDNLCGYVILMKRVK